MKSIDRLLAHLQQYNEHTNLVGNADPDVVVRDQIVAVPTLVKRLPVPERRIVGDLSDSAWMSLGLDLGSVEVSDGHPGPGE